MSNPLHPLLHNSNTRTWFIYDDLPQYAPMVSVYRVIITRTNARVLLKSFAAIGDTEPNPNSFPLSHFRNGMSVEVRYGDSGSTIEYNTSKLIAKFENAVVIRSWIGEMTIFEPNRRGLIPVWYEVWSDQWQLEFS